ncbi:ABATE domain-containing protein [Streptomyces mirabilis]|uniref:ABATE domain-containing protein n=1 Tax=Streptomyces mirabilis TaxID=68239 RepID=UPI003679F222
MQSGSLPPGPVPDAAAMRRLRAAVCDVLDSHLEGCPAWPTSVDDINAAAAAAPVSPRPVVTASGSRGEERWHTEHGGNAALAAIAAEAVGLLADHERLGLLRRCANPACSMLFLAENKRRKWCTSNICGQPGTGRPPLRTNPHRRSRRHLTRGAAAARGGRQGAPHHGPRATGHGPPGRRWHRRHRRPRPASIPADTHRPDAAACPRRELLAP